MPETDIHSDNFLYLIPGFASLPPNRIVSILEEPVCSEVFRREGEALGNGVPRYVVEPANDAASVYTDELNEIRLIDFGEGTLRESTLYPIVSTSSDVPQHSSSAILLQKSKPPSNFTRPSSS